MDAGTAASAEKLLPWTQEFNQPYIFEGSELLKDRKWIIDDIRLPVNPEPKHKLMDCQQASAIIDRLLDDNPGMISSGSKKKHSKVNQMELRYVSLKCSKWKVYKEKPATLSSIPVAKTVEPGTWVPVRMTDASGRVVWNRTLVLDYDAEKELYLCEGLLNATHS